VNAFPPHRDLDDTVKLTQRAGARHQHAPPHHRADSEQPDLDLHNLGPVGVRCRRDSSNDRSGWLRSSRHPISLSSIAPRRRGHLTLPDALRYLGLVHGYDQKPKRRLFETLKSQGLQANQDVTFLTDGGEEVRALTELVTPEAEHVLDWFHITMRLTVLSQYARGVAHHDKAEGARLLAALDSIKWLLWHGNQYRAGEEIAFFEDDVDGLELEYPNLGKFTRAAHEFAVYIAINAGSLINYGERFRSGERISSCLAESTVNALISKRFAKRQQMQWTKRGAHLLLQTRTRTLDGTLRPLFERWYPGLANDNGNGAAKAAAA